MIFKFQRDETGQLFDFSPTWRSAKRAPELNLNKDYDELVSVGETNQAGTAIEEI